MRSSVVRSLLLWVYILPVRLCYKYPNKTRHVCIEDLTRRKKRRNGCAAVESQPRRRTGHPIQTEVEGGLVTCKASHEKTYRVIGRFFLPDRPAEYYISERL